MADVNVVETKSVTLTASKPIKMLEDQDMYVFATVRTSAVDAKAMRVVEKVKINWEVLSVVTAKAQWPEMA